MRQIEAKPLLPEDLNRAVAAYRAGNLLEAEQLCQKILDQRCDLFDALHLFAIVQSRLGKKVLALTSYDRALKARPDSAEALFNQGNTLHDLGRFEDALASYDRALQVRPNYAKALSNRGLVLRELGRFEDALNSYDRVLRANPDSAEALASRGATLHEMKRFEEALINHDRALAVRPDFVEALNNRGLTLQELKRFAEALESYDRALAMRPDHVEALNNRGLVLHDLKRFAEALESYDRALKFRSDFAAALSNRGATLQELGRFDEAVASYRRALAARPDFAEAHNSLGVALMQVGRLSEAREALEKAVELAPSRGKFRRDLGDIKRFGAGDPDLTALERLARNTAALPISDQVETHFALAKAYEDVGLYTEAFVEWLKGNALKRKQITYDEASTLGMLNDVRTLFTSKLIRKWQAVGHPSSVPIFILGMPRSGSTLVEQILASHPQVFGGGELKHFHGATQRIRMKFGSSATFPAFVSDMTDKDYYDLAQRYLADTERLSPAALRITDKLPMNFIFAGLIHMALPNAAIIHTVRDPLDTCLSCFAKLFSDEQNHTYDLAELGRYYRNYQALMAHWHNVLPPERILDVHYENVVADLEGQARRIIAYCGLNWDPCCLAFHQTQRPVFTASMAQVRQPIYNSAIGRWRVHEKSLQPLLAELGMQKVIDGSSENPQASD
jgi:tetratricopeptide (TPR) repeat protein